MNTRASTPQDNPWDSVNAAEEGQAVDPKAIAKLKKPLKDEVAAEALYDMEGLMSDFPTAKDLERFVYDETGIVLSLKGRAQKLKYQVAMDALNGRKVDSQFVGKENPYIDKADMVPVEDIKEPPSRDTTLPPLNDVQNSFHSRMIPHTDQDLRAAGRHVEVTFRKYNNGAISYEVLGPIDERPKGEKIDKYGRVRPEVITWVDPRTGEQTAQRPDGTLTPQGKKLRALMKTFRVNNTNQWEIWVDRDFVQNQDAVIRNPWDLGE
ncbi:hypothetical protein UFOVP849_22 [uncultured Caudovirales phage]|uniref:Uncharacterized protein n=1 Tax=uncultured Caudovirales phage TaxID=2100421 RepID=A0A6J5PF07_9CAUD|nr:hypothetical protein UFOVP849_22 [uncultured Caudovirales phage]